MREIVIVSTLSVSAATLWQHVVSPNGINREFRPLLRMSFPAGVDDVTDGWRPGKRQYRSWVLLFGLLPLEYDDVTFAEVEPGRRFLERSTMLSQGVWEHERVLEEVEEGCRLTDRVRFRPRLTWLSAVYAPIFAAIFRWRHRNLRIVFGLRSRRI